MTEIEKKSYTISELQKLRGIKNPSTAQRYVSRVIPPTDDTRPRRRELSPENIKDIDAFISSKRSYFLKEGPEIYLPDGTAAPLLKSENHKELLRGLIDARNEERPFYMQEPLDPNTNILPQKFPRWIFRSHIARLKKRMKGTGWVIDSLTKDAYFLRHEKESPDELRELLETKRQIDINSTLIVLNHLLEESQEDKLNRNIHILLANALHRSSPESTLPSVFKDTSSEHLKKFFIYGFVHTLEKLWERKYARSLPLEEKRIIDCCDRLKQNGLDTQKIINSAKLHFSITTAQNERYTA